MRTPGPEDFASQLQRFRVRAGLSQASLAERANLSTNSISHLERRINKQPYPDTVGRLAEALGLSADERATFAAAARSPWSAAAPAEGSDPGDVSPRGPGAVPVPPTPMIGRQRELAEAVALLGRAEVRLVTLTGPGGVGKTRLALATAEAIQDAGRFRDGAVFVDLAPIRESALVVTAIARSLGIAESGTAAPAARVFEHLMPRQIVLVLDNFEHLLEAVSLVKDLLATCPLVKILTTSRVRLRLRGERVLVVPPLSLPDENVGLSEELAASDAVRLLADRMADVEPAFAVTEENAGAMAAICRRLDGLPLALELVAPWARVLTPEELRRRLEEGRLPSAVAASDFAPRQRTMRETIAWSYDMLDAGEQSVLRSLSVFSGGWTLEAAEAVVSAAEGNPGDVLLRLAGLVDKSLINVAGGPGGGAAAQRYGMLETVREFAAERLITEGEATTSRRRHAEFFLAMSERARRELGGPNQVAWLDLLEQEHANFQVALAWCLDGAVESERSDNALRFANALWPFWTVRGFLHERRVWLERAVHASGSRVSQGYATALLLLANTAYDLDENERASRLYMEAMRSWSILGDDGGVAAAIGGLGSVANNQGRTEEATRLHLDALSRWEKIDSLPNRAVSLKELGRLASDQGDGDRARAYFRQAREIWGTLGDIEGVAYCDHGLGRLLRREGRLSEAREVLERTLAAFREVDDRRGVARAMHELACVARQLEQWVEAIGAHRAALTIQVELSDDQAIIESVEEIAALAVEFGKLDDAALLWHASDAWRTNSGTVRTAADDLALKLRQEATQLTLGQIRSAQASARGASMKPVQAAAVARWILDTVTTEVEGQE